MAIMLGKKKGVRTHDPNSLYRVTLPGLVQNPTGGQLRLKNGDRLYFPVPYCQPLADIYGRWTKGMDLQKKMPPVSLAWSSKGISKRRRSVFMFNHLGKESF